MTSMNLTQGVFTIPSKAPIKTFRIVNSRDRVIDGLTGLTLSQAEIALTRCLNHGCNAYMQDESAYFYEYLAKKLTRDEIFELISIGFSKPVLYKRAVWSKAKKFMENIVCPLGYAVPHDFGADGGKFKTNYDIDDVKDFIADRIAID